MYLLNTKAATRGTGILGQERSFEFIRTFEKEVATAGMNEGFSGSFSVPVCFPLSPPHFINGNACNLKPNLAFFF